MVRKLFALLVVLPLAGVASAQRVEKPFRAEVGLYVPTFSGGHKDVGASVGFGYSLLRRNGFDIAAVVRGSFYGFSDRLPGVEVDSDFSLATYGIDVRYRPMGRKVFAGLGLGAAYTGVDADVRNDSFGDFRARADTTKLGYSLEAGYDFTTALYGVVRFQATLDDIRTYRGLTVGVGYRF